MCNFRAFEPSNHQHRTRGITTDRLMEEITTFEQISTLIDTKCAAIVFKYSPACGVSRVAQEAWDRFANQAHDIHLAQCDVIQARPAARGMVDLVKVAHQSPQVLVLKNGACLAHASHYSITPAWLDRQGSGCFETLEALGTRCGGRNNRVRVLLARRERKKKLAGPLEDQPAPSLGTGGGNSVHKLRPCEPFSNLRKP